ncbi:TetR/AcrR family transcriptional regulator [Nocardia ninae]|uniref:TetR family transcriptional regulator n=1 Tax=Nocardia ninae NBRC 108245 TaxID=1210091 RepID=A0A511M9I1_9NOCA|nr:TetR/AcrR family transcriptional regulator [Nocardia ninae]GEM36366.1 TetR family transcriptional regulator [Nocardia ninae NBRC 108245]
MVDDIPPDELVRLWRLPTGPKLGRPAGLDVDQVVRTAVELADRDGLSGATLPKIAERLGVTPMSLYRHIGSKEELFVLMADAANGFPPEFPAPHDDWRPALHEWAVALWSVHRRRPWLTQLPISGPPSGPGAIGWMDAGLRALRPTGLDAGTKVGVVMVVSGYVRQADLLAQQLEQGRRTTGLDETQVNRNYGRHMARLVDSERFPDAAELFGSGLFESAPPPSTPDPSQDDFEFGLGVVLDGVAATVARAEAGA